MRTQKFFVSGMKNQDARNNANDISRWDYREIARKTFPVNTLLILPMAVSQRIHKITLEERIGPNGKLRLTSPQRA